MKQYIKPDWPVPKNVKAYTTTRIGGVSKLQFASFNLSLASEDNPDHVLINRKKLIQELNLPQEPFWLKQMHTDLVLNLDESHEPGTVADASFTTTSGPVCVVLTADCVPILLGDTKGTIVAAIHAGWKGILNEVIKNTIETMDTDPKKLMAWLGPAIGPKSFEVNEKIREMFCQKMDHCKNAFTKHNDRFLANIYLLASLHLKQTGVTKIYGGNYCTYTQKNLFYSFRRDGQKSGRMATLIWLEE